MKQEMNIDSVLEQLGNNRPRFGTELSYQQLMLKVKRVQHDTVPKTLLVASACILILLLILNIATFEKKAAPKEKGLVQELHLMSNNSIYGEI